MKPSSKCNRENNMIKLQDVVKEYKNGVKALDGVTFDVKRGEFVFFVGPSGAGKSTLVKLLLKELDATQGYIKVHDLNLADIHSRRIPYLRRKLGVVFQDYRLLSNKTVYENVAFAMEIIGASEREIRKQVPTILSVVGLSEKHKRYPHELSGGEQQRVSIARAMINNPPILIADEPTGNLDPDTSWEIMKILRQINRTGTTILMTTHNKEIVDIMQQRVIALEKGKVVRDEQKGGYGYED
jgi:cell division transport system ATP-binding protein